MKENMVHIELDLTYEQAAAVFSYLSGVSCESENLVKSAAEEKPNALVSENNVKADKVAIKAPVVPDLTSDTPAQQIPPTQEQPEAPQYTKEQTQKAAGNWCVGIEQRDAISALMGEYGAKSITQMYQKDASDINDFCEKLIKMGVKF